MGRTRGSSGGRAGPSWPGPRPESARVGSGAMDGAPGKPKRMARRSLLWGLAALPPAVTAACAAPGNTGPPAASVVPGKVLVLSYQTSGPRLEMQTALYDELSREL